jgi:hypothetical protein
MKRTYRELQLILKEYRANGAIPACEIRLNAKRSVLEQAIVDCIKFERTMCAVKLELNPNASINKKEEWKSEFNLYNRMLEIIAINAA